MKPDLFDFFVYSFWILFIFIVWGFLSHTFVDVYKAWKTNRSRKNETPSR
jgi:hypothetical protein